MQEKSQATAQAEVARRREAGMSVAEEREGSDTEEDLAQRKARAFDDWKARLSMSQTDGGAGSMNPLLRLFPSVGVVITRFSKG